MSVERAPRMARAEARIPSLVELIGCFEDDWRPLSACKGAPWELFWPLPDGERARGVPPRAVEAAAYCQACPVIDQCRRWADTHRVLGVWAGEWRIGKYTAYKAVPIVAGPERVAS